MLNGFIIEKFGDLKGWKALELDSSVPITQHPQCQCCLNDMREIVALVSLQTKLTIRIGCCPICGTVRYIDTPDEKWVINFYIKKWDKGKPPGDATSALNPKPSRIAQIVSSLPISKNDFICDVGCGYGGSLYHLQQSGFNNLLGIENSEHRARLTQKTRDLRTIVGDFSNKNVIEKISKTGRPKVLFTAHVLEHVSNPQKFIKTAYDLQQDADYLVISVPNFQDEVSMAILMFLPHLTSFTPAGLMTLLNQCGYQVTQDFTNPKEITVVAQKNKSLTGANFKNPSPEIIEIVEKKFVHELSLANRSGNRLRRLWWLKNDSSKSGQIPYYQNFLLESVNFSLRSLTLPLKKARSIIISNLKHKTTKAPIEIQFRDGIQMFYK